MKNVRCLFAVAFSSLGTLAVASPFAESVINYQPGSLPASVASYTNASAALGEPSRVTPGLFGGPVDPFNPPYLNSQLVALGSNGSLTLQFSTPILNQISGSGIDFVIFGNTGFVITNGDYSGGGITDGSTFGQNSGLTQVSVSADNVLYYQLNPSLAPTVDGLFPTDGSGSFQIPVNPALTASDFAGKNLAQIRGLYQGSAGGTGYDLAWAPTAPPGIRFVRIDVLQGVSEIDGMALVAVPEPSTISLVCLSLLGAWTARRNRGRR